MLASRFRPLIVTTALVIYLGCSGGSGSKPGGATPGDAPAPSATSPKVGSTAALPPGSARVSGTAAGFDLTRLTHAFVVEPMPGTQVIVLSESAEPCQPSEALHLVLYACKMPSTAEVRSGRPDCQSQPDSGMALLEGETDIASAAGGSITVTSVDATAISGDFSIELADAPVTGSYHATICPTAASESP